jgi:hypothetical protein
LYDKFRVRALDTRSFNFLLLSFEEEGLLYIHPTKSVSVPRNDISHQTDSEKSESDKMSTLNQSDALKKIDCLGGLFIPTYMLTY